MVHIALSAASSIKTTTCSDFSGGAKAQQFMKYVTTLQNVVISVVCEKLNNV